MWNIFKRKKKEKNQGLKNETIKVKTIDRISNHLYEVTIYDNPLGNNNINNS